MSVLDEWKIKKMGATKKAAGPFDEAPQTKIDIGQAIGQAVLSMLDEELLSNSQQWPVRSNRASELGHPCIRYHVLNRRRWQEKALFDVAVLRRFEEGKLHEKAVLSVLATSGVHILEQQRPFSWDEYDITGSIDGKLNVDETLALRARLPKIAGLVLPLEIKSASETSFARINTLRDMLEAASLYVQKYPTQMTLYLLMDGKELGLFAFKDKSSGALKFIPMELDYEYGEGILKRVEKVNSHLKDKTPDNQVERVDYSEMTCSSCAFVHLCVPDVKREAIKFEDDPELIAKLNQWAELADDAKLYNLIDKALKERLKGIDKALIGDWYITGKESIRKNKAKEASETPVWKTTIVKLGG